MARNRYLLCLLGSGIMLYYALPKLQMDQGLEGVFSISWLTLCLFVIAGNLSALLYTPRNSKQREMKSGKKGKRIRQYE